jgi:hypothetical protein
VLNVSVNNLLRLIVLSSILVQPMLGCDQAPSTMKDGDVVEVYHAAGSNVYHFDTCLHWKPDMRGAPSTFGQLRRLWSERSDKAMPCPDCAQPRLRAATR